MTYSKHSLFEKTAAAPKEVMSRMVQDPHFWAPLAVAAVGTAVGSAAGAVAKVREARARTHAYKEMLDIHPQLKGRDPVLVQRIYKSLHHANPHMAKDPMVAGAWVDTIVESAGVDPTMASQALLSAVKDLSGIRSQISTARRNEPDVAASWQNAATQHANLMITRAKEIERDMGENAMLRKALEDKGKKDVTAEYDHSFKRMMSAQNSLASTLSARGVDPARARHAAMALTVGEDIPDLSPKATRLRHYEPPRPGGQRGVRPVSEGIGGAHDMTEARNFNPSERVIAEQINRIFKRKTSSTQGSKLLAAIHR
jgi:hypothetical protein